MADTAATPTDRTWQPVTLGSAHGRHSVIWHEDRVYQPDRWKKAGRVLVPHLFHHQVPEYFITRVLDVMEGNPHITFVIPTEHAVRMHDFVQKREAGIRQDAARFDGPPDNGLHVSPAAKSARARAATPPANIWLGVTVNDQWTAKTRIPALLETPAGTRVVVCEPLTGPVDLAPFLTESLDVAHSDSDAPEDAIAGGMVRQGDQWHRAERLNWVIAGGGFGPNARPLHPQWARDLRDACAEHDVPFYFTQHGEYLAVPVVDDPDFAGGRAYNNPLAGGRSSATLRERGPSRTLRAGTTRLMEPGDRTKHTWLLDRDTIAVRVGRKTAGRELDGRLHDAVPTSSTATGPSAEAAASH